MATFKGDKYTFPDEAETKIEAEADVDLKVEYEEDNDEVKVEVIDAAPPEDQNVEPLNEEVKQELEKADSSADYSHNVKTKFKQYKKAWHDERRAKESALREQQEALSVAQKILDENKRLKSLIENGEKELISTYKSSAKLELEKAERAYGEAYDLGDRDRLIEAQKELIKAQNKLDSAEKFTPTVQTTENSVQTAQKQVPQEPQMDPKVSAWVSQNPWFTDPSKLRMRRFAEGVHEELAGRYGRTFIGTDEYFKAIDKEVRTVFSSEFGGTQNDDDNQTSQRQKPSTVVAPARRSTAPKKVTLTREQVSLAKKLGITPEQYARELTKLEA
jgi:hypothetical protein